MAAQASTYSLVDAELPPWSPGDCDGCTIPTRALRWWFDAENPAIRAVCCKHDEAYYYGGSARDRLEADRELLRGLLAAGMPAFKAFLVFQAVRLAGSPHFRFNRRRWAHGRGLYCYTPHRRRPGRGLEAARGGLPR